MEETMPKTQPAHILNSIKRIMRELEQLHADVTTFDFKQPQGVTEGPQILDCLNEWMKESQQDVVLKVRVKGYEGDTVFGELDYDILESNGDWVWSVNNIQFTTDDVEWIDPDWGIIMLKQTWVGE
jgi:hypothetical protein